jgi:hypothetical protein
MQNPQGMQHLNERDYFEDLDVDVKPKQDVRVWAGCNALRIGSSGVLLRTI